MQFITRPVKKLLVTLAQFSTPLRGNKYLHEIISNILKRIDKKLLKLASRKHKNSKILFYLKGISNLLTPDVIYRIRLNQVLDSIDQYNREYVLDRVVYYNKQQTPFTLGCDAVTFSDLTTKKDSAYYFDFQESIRYFDSSLFFHCEFGDVIEVPAIPGFVKSRPIKGKNDHSIVLKLNKVRHFTFVKDALSFQQKKNKLVWRGKAGVAGRIRFIKQHFQNPLFDIGQSNPPEKGGNPLRQKRFMPIEKQLQFKFILSIEGNDVATNLKWIMSSNSLCFMKKPIYETWFMEGRLIPNVHYVLLEDDYADIEEKIDYFVQHQDKALEIINNANAYCEQFKDNKRETLISLLVLKQYFEQSGQIT